MKRIIIALTIATILPLTLSAGESSMNYRSDKEVVASAPSAPEFSWTGFYLGASVGYKFTETNLDLDLFAGWDTAGNDLDRDAILDNAPNSFDMDGFEAGGVLGYLAQIDNIVVGFEVAGAFTFLDDRDEDNFIVSHPLSEDSDINLLTDLETKYLVTVAPRFGIAMGKFLPYVTGGLAIAELDFFQEISYNNPAAAGFTETGSFNRTQLGWMAGGGLQYAFNDNWSARVQYQYIDLGSHDVVSEGDTFPGFFGEHRVDLVQHNVSFAVIFKF